ncbi:MAG: tetratricopeptide repeat protein [Candidatus Riflebacteria bacterium]|nr:tetratricopeptide repeat protein [Candidatus Riflebacteria bacterium]
MKTHKETLKVVIYTPHYRIKGDVHLYENSRLTDIMNSESAIKDFLPVTNATIIEVASGNHHEVSFLSINRRTIEMVIEDDEAIAINKAKEAIAKRKFPEALQYAQRASKALPDDPEAHYLLGFCLAKVNDLKAAKTAMTKCLKMKPDAELAKQVQEFLGALP